MRYFKHTTEFTLPNGRTTVHTIHQSCEDADYDNEVLNASLNARVTAKRMCAGNEPDTQITVNELTLQQYNAAIPEVIHADLGDPTELESELDSE